MNNVSTKIRYPLLLALALSLSFKASGQGLINDSTFLKAKFNLQVKQLGQFIDRFNFDEIVKPSNGSQPSRFMNIISLINRFDTALTNSPTTMEFVEFCSTDANAVKLKFENPNWYASLDCDFVYKAKEVKGNLILRPEKSEKGGYKWVIAGVNLSILNNDEKDKKVQHFINPMNHEIGFSEITKALIEGRNLEVYSSKEYAYDELSVFFTYLNNKDLVLKQIGDIQFQFYQVLGWFFTVNNFNRSDFNSGWLMSRISKADETLKDAIKTNSHIKN